MSDFDHLFTSSAGVRWGYREDEGQKATLVAQQDVLPFLEANKATQGESGKSKSGELRIAASIPASVRLKWLTEEGWDCFSPEPECQRKLCQKLDDVEWAHLRVGKRFMMGSHWRHSI